MSLFKPRLSTVGGPFQKLFVYPGIITYHNPKAIWEDERLGEVYVQFKQVSRIGNAYVHAPKMDTALEVDASGNMAFEFWDSGHKVLLPTNRMILTIYNSEDSRILEDIRNEVAGLKSKYPVEARLAEFEMDYKPLVNRINNDELIRLILINRRIFIGREYDWPYKSLGEKLEKEAEDYPDAYPYMPFFLQEMYNAYSDAMRDRPGISPNEGIYGTGVFEFGDIDLVVFALMEIKR